MIVQNMEKGKIQSLYLKYSDTKAGNQNEDPNNASGDMGIPTENSAHALEYNLTINRLNKIAI